MNAVRMRRLMIASGADQIERLSDQVSGLGYQVAAAFQTGEEALQAVTQGAFDLLVLEESVGGSWDGPTLASMIRDTSGVPVLYVGDGANETEFHRVRAAEPYGFVCAPWSPVDLRVQLDLALHRIDLERERALSLPGRLAAHERLAGVEAMLPICSGCSKIHSHEGRWLKVDEYLTEHAQIQFTHSFCPCCEERLYGQKTQTASVVRAKRT